MTKITFVMLMSVIVGLWPVRPTLAQESPPIKIASFHVQEARTFNNGVWKAGAAAIDEQIVFLLESNQIESIEDFSYWLERNIAYEEANDKDGWRNPAKILTQRHGDCKSYSFLTAAVLRVAGFEPRIMACWKQGLGHMICAFKADGYYYWFDNDALMKTAATSLPAFAQEMVKEYDLNSLLELNTQSNQWEVLYKL